MSDHIADPSRQPGDEPHRETPEEQLFRCTYGRDVYGIQSALKLGADINATHPGTGLSALHIAVGLNDLPLSRYLIEKCAARFFADRSGRWPTLIAAQCRVDEALADYIVEAEARFLEQEGSA